MSNRLYLSTRTGRYYTVPGKPGDPIPDYGNWLGRPQRDASTRIAGTRNQGQLQLIGVNIKLKGKSK